MRIIYMGTPQIAVPPLLAIKAAGHDIALVVTQPDKPNSRRGREAVPGAVKKAALCEGFKIFQPENASSAESEDILKNVNADIAIVCAYGQLLKKNILPLTKYGFFNIHASLLPKYRGAAPITRAIMNGEIFTGITIMKMNAGLDTGDMAGHATVEIGKNTSGGELTEQLSKVAATLITQKLVEIENGSLKLTPQNEAQSCYAEKIDKKELIINFNQEAKSVHDFIRALSPTTPARAYLNGKSVQFISGVVNGINYQLRPGTITEGKKDGITVACKHGSIRLLRIKPEGKPEMDAFAFYNGLHDKTKLCFTKTAETDN